MEQFRTELRCMHKELKAKIGDEYKKSSTNKFIAKITNIKLYMTKTKNAKCRWETKKYGKAKKYTSQNEETQL